MSSKTTVFQVVNKLRFSGYFIYHQVEHSQIPRSAHTVYLYVLCGSQNKQRLLLYTTLTDWFVYPRWCVFTGVLRNGLLNIVKLKLKFFSPTNAPFY